MLSQSDPKLFTYTPEQVASVERAISRDRLARYLTTNSDWCGAIRRYEINIALSESLYGVLQGFEVALRNAMYCAVSDGFGTTNWLELFQFDEPERFNVEAAKAKIMRKQKAVTPAGIVAEMTLGFWVALTARHYAARLWVPYLHKAFPYQHLGHKAAFQRLSSIRILRNRIAHHECILFRDLARDYHEIIETTGWICPATAAWIRKTTRFEACYRRLVRVVPGD
jgi:hypothetical protein